MDRLMFTQYECLSCGTWLKKSQRQEHERRFDHNIARKGVIVEPRKIELIGKIITGRMKTPKGTIKEVPRGTKIEKSPDRYARELYPNVYLLLDTIRGSVLKPQR